MYPRIYLLENMTIKKKYTDKTLFTFLRNITKIDKIINAVSICNKFL